MNVQAPLPALRKSSPGPVGETPDSPNLTDVRLVDSPAFSKNTFHVSANKSEHRRRLPSSVLSPPSGESATESRIRLKSGNDTEKGNESIDKMIEIEPKRNAQKPQEEVNILLLGQSESGKSTALKRE